MRKLEAALGADRVDRYFRRDAQLSISGGTLNVAVPSPFHAGLIERRFGVMLGELVTECFGPGIRHEVTVEPDRFSHLAQPERSAPARANTARATAKRIHQPAESIDERFDLDLYLVGTSNRVAFDAAVRVADGADEDAFARLFIHGPCGVGKSHLLRGIARRRSRNSGARVRCVSAEAFTNEYIQAVQNSRVDAFRHRYRDVDLLCIDDVHFLAGKNATQVELLHTLDAIELGGARLVLASDEHPQRIGELTKALSSRFVSGMVVQVDIPDTDLRGRLLREFAGRRGVRLTDDAVASLRDGRGREWSAREIQGMMTRLQAAATLEGLTGAPLGPSEVERLLRGAPRPEASAPVRYDQIRDAVCGPLEVESVELGKAGRHPRVVMARAVITLLCREFTTMSYPEIARALGKRNHSTVITAHRRIETQLDEAVRLGLPIDGLTIGQFRDRVRETIRPGGPAAPAG
jgi:chromosomal replication initiator protein